MCAPKRFVRISTAVVLSALTAHVAVARPRRPAQTIGAGPGDLPCLASVHIARFESGVIYWNSRTRNYGEVADKPRRASGPVVLHRARGTGRRPGCLAGLRAEGVEGRLLALVEAANASVDRLIVEQLLRRTAIRNPPAEQAPIPS